MSLASGNFVSSDLRPLLIKSALGDYQVEFWSDIKSALGQLSGQSGIFFVIDQKVEKLYRAELSSITSRWPTLLLNADENTKTLNGVGQLTSWLQEKGANKRSQIVAIGGGIIQDLCAFVSHVYYRGIPWVFIPTTLLSMCDSCIGAKSSINHGGAKNQLGAFHAPQQVHIVPAFLQTLEVRDLKSGFGEILKLMLTETLSDFDQFEALLSKSNGNLLAPWLPSLIRRSLEIKKAIIEVDEFEKDLRRVLNFGHTFGHAFESLSDYELPHGLAVAWGVDLVNHIAMRKGLIGSQLANRVSLVIQNHLSVKTQFRPKLEALLAGIKSDKKAESGHVNLILLHESPFGLKVVPQDYDSRLREWVAEYFEKSRLFAT